MSFAAILFYSIVEQCFAVSELVSSLWFAKIGD